MCLDLQQDYTPLGLEVQPRRYECTALVVKKVGRWAQTKAGMKADCWAQTKAKMK